MDFFWKPIKNINKLPRGVEILVCIPKTDKYEGYCEYIRRGDLYGSENENPHGWYYVYTNREVSNHKVKAFKYYCIPIPFDSTRKKKIKNILND